MGRSLLSLASVDEKQRFQRLLLVAQELCSRLIKNFRWAFGDNLQRFKRCAELLIEVWSALRETGAHVGTSTFAVRSSQSGLSSARERGTCALLVIHRTTHGVFLDHADPTDMAAEFSKTLTHLLEEVWYCCCHRLRMLWMIGRCLLLTLTWRLMRDSRL